MKKLLWGIFGILVIVASFNSNHSSDTTDNAALAKATSFSIGSTLNITSVSPSVSSLNVEVTPLTTPSSLPQVNTVTPLITATVKPVISSTPTFYAKVSASNKSNINVDENKVQSPVKAAVAPAGATAQCKDGSYSFSVHRQGTCSKHRGVANWL